MKIKKEKNKIKKLKLKPSLREKSRYLLFEYAGKKPEEVIDKAIFDFIGVLGYSKACPKILKLKKQGNYTVGVLSVKRKEVDRIKAALLSSEIRIKKISGSLKKLE